MEKQSNKEVKCLGHIQTVYNFIYVIQAKTQLYLKNTCFSSTALIKVNILV